MCVCVCVCVCGFIEADTGIVDRKTFREGGGGGGGGRSVCLCVKIRSAKHDGAARA